MLQNSSSNKQQPNCSEDMVCVTQHIWCDKGMLLCHLKHDYRRSMLHITCLHVPMHSMRKLVYSKASLHRRPPCWGWYVLCMCTQLVPDWLAVCVSLSCDSTCTVQTVVSVHPNAARHMGSFWKGAMTGRGIPSNAYIKKLSHQRNGHKASNCFVIV